MPVVKAAFADGLMAESNLRLLCDAWSDAVAEVVRRDEHRLCGWAIRLPHRDFRLVLDTWRMHADPDREDDAAAERFDRRSLHLSSMLDGMGRLDGVLDPEAFALVREAVRALSRPSETETRSAAQRRADALTEMARIAPTWRWLPAGSVVDRRSWPPSPTATWSAARGVVWSTPTSTRRSFPPARSDAWPATATCTATSRILSAPWSTTGVAAGSSPIRCSTRCSSVTTAAAGRAVRFPPDPATPITPSTGWTGVRPGPTIIAGHSAAHLVLLSRRATPRTPGVTVQARRLRPGCWSSHGVGNGSSSVDSASASARANTARAALPSAPPTP